jgi:hypothetical protein
MANERDESLGGEIDSIMGSFNDHVKGAHSALIDSQPYFYMPDLLKYYEIYYHDAEGMHELSPIFLGESGGLYCEKVDLEEHTHEQASTHYILLLGSVAILGGSDDVRNNIASSKLLTDIVNQLCATKDEVEEIKVTPEQSNTPTGFVFSRYIAPGRYFAYQVLNRNDSFRADISKIEGNILLSLTRVAELVIISDEGRFTYYDKSQNNE